jgi:hypothetical protein
MLNFLSITSDDLQSVMKWGFHLRLATTAFGRDLLLSPLIWLPD